MVEGRQNIGFTLEILNNRLLDSRITGLVDHFFYSHQLNQLREMEIAGPVDGAHPANTDDFLDQIAVNEGDAGS